MDPARWQHIQDLFDAALDRPANARADFLADACGDDTALYDEVRSLLAADAQGHSLLDGLAVNALDLPSDETLPFPTDLRPGLRYAPGDHIGPYRLLEPLASGGMGTVFLAERADGQFEQRVALKLVRSGLASEVVLARFQQERQILARLHHPHIARLLDGGLTEHGHPYFAMEYVEGTPLTAYCDARQLSVPDRLALFLDIGRAVQVAHRNLVVHRDLKPSNILVTEDGQVKLLDFGIAKVLTDTDADLETPLTRTGMRVMTPEYAAPEQIRGEPVTTATDVYALGVILYELLTGRRPHESAHRWEVEQAVLQTEPLRPSTAVRQWASSGDTRTHEARLGETRNATVDHLVRRLRGDLDTICQKALQKRPDERYASVEQFMEDVRRHLDGLPIIARRPTTEYRLRKFVQRHRTGVLATTAGLVLLLVLVTFYTVRLAQERNRAQQEAEKATQIAGFLTDLFQASDPSESLGATITARELLERGTARIDTALLNQPETRVELLHTIGEVYSSLGDIPHARAMLEEALALGRQTRGVAHLDNVKTMDALAWILWQVGDLDTAEVLYREALAIRRRELSATHPDVGTSLHNLAHLFYQRGDFDAAEPLYRDALRIQTDARGENHLFVAGIQESLGQTLQFLGRYDEAEALMQQALTTRRAQQSPIHPELATTLHNMAVLQSEMGHTETAIALFTESLTMTRQILGPDHPDVGAELSAFAWTLYENGDFAAADTTFREAIRINRQVWGPDHFNVGYDLQNWAKLQQRLGHYAAADSLYERALAIYRSTLSEDDPYLSSLLYGLGLMRTEQGRAPEAERMLREATTIARNALPAEHWLTLSLESALGAALSAQQKYDEAGPLLANSYERLKAMRSLDDTYTQRSLRHLLAHYDGLGLTDEAQALSPLVRTEAF